jgi:hypothetical protein
MKYTLKFTLLLLAVAVFSVSCKKLLEEFPTTFNIPYTSTFTIPAGTTINLPINISTPDITTNFSSTLEAQKTSTDLVKKVSLDKFTLKVLSPSTGNFNF